jgi:hypothetical protein
MYARPDDVSIGVLDNGTRETLGGNRALGAGQGA